MPSQMIREMTIEAERLEAEAKVLRGLIHRLKSGEAGLIGLSENVAPRPTRQATAPINPRYTGLRDRIRNILIARRAGLRPVEVANELKAEGFKSQSKTPFNSLVSGELARMKKQGQVKKTAQGLYQLTND